MSNSLERMQLTKGKKETIVGHTSSAEPNKVLPLNHQTKTVLYHPSFYPSTLNSEDFLYSKNEQNIIIENKIVLNIQINDRMSCYANFHTLGLRYEADYIFKNN